jgi:hypothetical protein
VDRYISWYVHLYDETVLLGVIWPRLWVWVCCQFPGQVSTIVLGSLYIVQTFFWLVSEKSFLELWCAIE